MEKFIDKVFGEMEYKHSWTKKEAFLFLDKAYVVNIVAQAYKGDVILESQQLNYTSYKKNLEDNYNKIVEKLNEYCKSNFDTEVSLDKCLIPKTIIFERDGSWGILFDTDYDTENGIAVFFIKEKIKIGSQDLFL